MRSRFIISILSLIVSVSCVDRVFFDIKIPDTYAISISGFISDQPGPYQVTVLRTFDIESKENLRTGVSARVVLSDAEGNSEVMDQVISGVYESSPEGMRGKIGGVYKLKVELDDGRVFESVPDTLREGGSIDSIHYKFTNRQSVNGTAYDFEIFGQSSSNADLSKTHLMWRNKATFKSRLHPEFEQGNCYRIPEQSNCNFLHPCTGLKNVGTDFEPRFERVGPCTCCICWYDAYNSQVTLNDKISAINGRFPEIMIDRIQMNGWNMMFKMRVEVSVQSLSPQAYVFWKAVRDQYSAVTNIFQPITGKIPGNLAQTSGNGPAPRGIFYATSISSKYFYILRSSVREDIIPDAEHTKAAAVPCFNLFPNSSTGQPAFWVE